MLMVAGVAAVDTEPGQLRITDRVGLLPAVASRLVLGAGDVGVGVELRILAASHQVVVTRPGGRVHVETVACGLASGARLADGSTFALGGWVTATEIRSLGAADFSAVAAAWRARGRLDPEALVVQFPGPADALTGLAVEPGDAGVGVGVGVGWCSMHSYPSGGDGGGGVVVLTRTVPAASALGSAAGGSGGDVACPA